MRRAIAQVEKAQLADEVEHLATLSHEQLDARWRELFDGPRPRRIYGALLVDVLAYRLQERVLGGIKATTRRLLRQVAGSPAERRSSAAVAKQPRLKTGAVLLRDWHGTTHRVTVEEHGFEYRGQAFKSLSEIACRITGNRWSGPLFFGLKSREQTHAGA